MDSNDDRLPSLPLPMHSVPSYHSGRRSLPPLAVSAALPTYPSSTLHFYYPSSHQVANYASIPPVTLQPFTSQAWSPDGGVPGIFPSISQSRVPSLRRTPSSHSDLAKVDPFPAVPSPLLAHRLVSPVPASPFLDRRFQNTSRTSLHYLPPSPTTFASP